MTMHNGEHRQLSPRRVWKITHHLGFCPEVRITDGAGQPLTGIVRYPTLDHMTITFDRAETGIAYLD
jgi:hypothetical protein